MPEWRTASERSWLRHASYLTLRPATISSAWRLYTALLVSAIHKAIRPRVPVNVGKNLSGHEPLLLRFRGWTVAARPGTDDLWYWTAGHKRATEEWFAPTPGDVVVDVGSGVGYFALVAAASGGKVWAFEPCPGTCALLIEIVRANNLPTIRVDGRALGKSATSAVIYECAENPGMASLNSGWVGPNTHGPIVGHPIRVETLDTVMIEYSLQGIDWLLLDVEGSELAVLEGAARALEVTRRIIIELSEPTREDVTALLNERGFRQAAFALQSARTAYGLFLRC